MGRRHAEPGAQPPCFRRCGTKISTPCRAARTPTAARLRSGNFFVHSHHPPQPRYHAATPLAQGWVPVWRDPMLAAVLVFSVAIGLLSCTILLSRWKLLRLVGTLQVTGVPQLPACACAGPARRLACNPWRPTPAANASCTLRPTENKQSACRREAAHGRSSGQVIAPRLGRCCCALAVRAPCWDASLYREAMRAKVARSIALHERTRIAFPHAGS